MHTHGDIESGLPTHRRQDSIDILFFNDLCDHLFGDRFDIGTVSEFRIGHDRRRVGVDQYDTVSEFLECLGSLCAGVVKFTGLPDDDRP